MAQHEFAQVLAANPGLTVQVPRDDAASPAPSASELYAQLELYGLAHDAQMQLSALGPYNAEPYDYAAAAAAAEYPSSPSHHSESSGLESDDNDDDAVPQGPPTASTTASSSTAFVDTPATIPSTSWSAFQQLI